MELKGSFNSVYLILISLQLFVLRTSCILDNKFITSFAARGPRRYIYLEGKYGYSVHLILEKGDNSLINSTNQIEFIIRAPEYPYYGVMAIIQRLYLRKLEVTEDGTQTCRDYIQFSPEQKNSSLENSSEICGSVERELADESQPLNLIGPRTYYNAQGNMIMTVKVDHGINQDDQDLDIVGAEIVFTAYTECPGTEVGLKTLSYCSIGQRISCIPTSLFCDSKIDCGFDDGFGWDEKRCYFPYVYGGISLIFISIVLLAIYAFIRWIRFKAKQISSPTTTIPSQNAQEFVIQLR